MQPLPMACMAHSSSVIPFVSRENLCFPRGKPLNWSALPRTNNIKETLENTNHTFKTTRRKWSIDPCLSGPTPQKHALPDPDAELVFRMIRLEDWFRRPIFESWLGLQIHYRHMELPGL